MKRSMTILLLASLCCAGAGGEPTSRPAISKAGPTEFPPVRGTEGQYVRVASGNLGVVFREGATAYEKETLRRWLLGMRFHSGKDGGGEFSVTHSHRYAMSYVDHPTIDVDLYGEKSKPEPEFDALQGLADAINAEVRAGAEMPVKLRSTILDRYRRLEVEKDETSKDVMKPAPPADPAAALVRQEEIHIRLALFEKEARQQALREAIDSAQSEAQRSAEKDEVLAEYRKLVTLAESEASIARRSEGAVSQAEVLAADVKVANAKARCAERALAISKTNRGELLDKLSDELTFVGIDLASLKTQSARVADWANRLDTLAMRSSPEAARVRMGQIMGELEKSSASVMPLLLERVEVEK